MVLVGRLKAVLATVGIGAAAVTLLFGAAPARADAWEGGRIGVVLMHGKGGTDSLVAPLGNALEAAGVLVRMPSMPWSAARIYDKGYEEAMVEIDAHVAALRAAGATRVVVAGHSIGANAALGYAARRSGLAGTVLLAYGHVPGKRGVAQKLAGSVAKARAMVAAGRGAETAEFDDFGGTSAKATASAEDVLSWFDPDGPATLAGNAATLKPGLPVLCIDGARDRNKRCEEILRRIPSGPGNRQVRVDADHKGTPAAASGAVLTWLRALP